MILRTRRVWTSKSSGRGVASTCGQCSVGSSRTSSSSRIKVGQAGRSLLPVLFTQTHIRSHPTQFARFLSYMYIAGFDSSKTCLIYRPFASHPATFSGGMGQRSSRVTRYLQRAGSGVWQPARPHVPFRHHGRPRMAIQTQGSLGY